MQSSIDPEVLKRLDALTAKLGTTADHVWSLLIRQAHIEAISDSIFLVMILCAAFCVVRWFLYIIRCENEKDGNTEPGFAQVACLIATAVVVLALLIIEVFALPTEIFNPEFYALRQIEEVFKK